MTGQSTISPLRGGRPRKRWTYVGLFGPDLMLCAAEVEILVARQAFWAVWDRRAGRLSERTRFVRAGRVRVRDARVLVRDAEMEIELALDRGKAVEARCPSGDSWAWTRKTPVVARGTVNRRPVELRGLLDESAGYHAREVDWRWSAGVGRSADGREVAWNLVSGINDPVVGSERAVWVDGEPAEVGPVDFSSDLASIRFGEGGRLDFAPEARRARSDDFVVFASDYEAPFGMFSGSMPAGGALAEGFGVMERHRARW